MKKILDASVIAKWFLEERGSRKALLYLKDFTERKYILVEPTLIFYELGNVFLYKNLPVKEVSAIMEKFQELPFEREDVGFDSFRKIYQNAQEYKITFYDASYLTLMQRYNCELITADRKLFNTLKPHFTKVRLLN